MFACTRENDDYKSIGTITGIDGTMCGCCGGWIINIDDFRYLIDSMPNNSNLDLSKKHFLLQLNLIGKWLIMDAAFLAE